MNGFRLLISSILLFSTVSTHPFWDGFLEFFGIENESEYYEPLPDHPHLYESSPEYDYSPVSPSVLRGYTRALKLKGVTGRKKMPGLYHHESCATVPLEEDWKCGLHMLYNMCELERILGISDISDDEFIWECEQIPAIFDKKGSYPSDLKKIARFTAVAPLYIIEHNDYAQRIDIVYGSRTEENFWRKILNRLEKPGVQCIHFGCLIYDKDNLDENENPECHIFLISVVKLEDGSRAIYLLDNMNHEASRSSQEQMLKHAEYIHEHIFS